MLDCTIIIVSFNTKDLTDKCLTKAEEASIHAKEKLKNKITIIVVDNASHDGTVEMIQKKHPHVTLIALPENIRYGRGNNVGMAKAKTPFYIILNSDAFLEKETLAKALIYMQNHPNCDALSCKVLFADGSFQPSGGYLPTPFKTLLWAFGIDSLPILKYVLHPIYLHTQGFYKKERPIEWCQGSFMLLREKVYKQTKGFDEKIFFYMEDIEWCKRIHDAGFTLLYTPTITLTHLTGQSTKQIAKKERLEQGAVGMLYYIKKHYPHSLQLIQNSMAIGMLLRSVFYFVIGKVSYAKIYSKLFTFINKQTL